MSPARPLPPISAELLENFEYDHEQGLLYWEKNKCNNIRAGDIVSSLNSKGYRHVSLNGRNIAVWYLTGTEYQQLHKQTPLIP